MLVSRGVLTKSPSTVWEGTTDRMPGWLLDRWRLSSYGAMYRRHMWVAVLVNKIANATARLPLKVYERDGVSRPEAPESPYAQLLRNPHPQIDPYFFWLWTVSTLNIHGEAFWLKDQRNQAGVPTRLRPLDPTWVHSEERDGTVTWALGPGRQPVERHHLVHFRMFNPDSLVRGMSPLEPLRATLENEDGARRANSALWNNGARPSVALKHPGQLSEQAQDRIRASWQKKYGGVDNWGLPAVLEEGMEAQVLSLNAEELQYIEGRKLNREECCAVYDVPPPVVHILDRATFSNITEQMRSMYRDTMAPKLRLIESTLETELRDGRMGRPNRDPDFSPDTYAEFLLDEVLRGDFEKRAEAYQRGINSGWMTPAEVRELENLPFIEDSDQLFINSAVVPIADAEEPAPQAAVRGVLGRLGRVASLEDVDVDALGLNGHTEDIRAALTKALASGESLQQFRQTVKELIS